MNESDQFLTEHASTILSTVGALVIVMDRDGHIVLFNQACQDLTGYSEQEALGKMPWDFLLPFEVRDAVKSVFAELSAGHFPNSYENAWLTKGGAERLISWSNTAICRDDQSVKYVIGTGIDITERIEAEEALKRSVTKFRHLSENTSDWIWEVDAQGAYTYVSPKVIEVLGYSSDEILGKTPFDHMPPEEAQRVGELFASIAQEAKPFEALENINIHKDGHKVVLETSGVPIFDNTGECIGYRGIDRDITERKNAQDQVRVLSQAVEQSSNMIFITDVNGVIQYVNPKFTELTGYTSEEAIGELPSLIQYGETPMEVYQELWQTILAGNEWRGEFKDRRKDGKVFWAAATINPVRNERGQVTHFVAMHEDISHRKLAEEKIQQAMEHAMVASRAKSELLANMSHELRTPLNAIIGFSNTIRDQVFGPLENTKYIEYAGDILLSGEHLLELINDILDVSAIEAGKVELRDDDVSVPKTVDACLLMVNPRAQKGKVSLIKDFSYSLPMLKADERRLKQILINLLSNAIKFTEEGGLVTITAELTKNNQIQLSVTDTGVGMTDVELKKAMTQFGQADSGLDRKHEGTGLGLPLTKGLVDLHNGEFQIESVKGKGTSVSITFPPERVIHPPS